MKRLFYTAIIIVTIVLLFRLAIYEHPGRTDSNGGHYNRSTGEYHYHHGYSEHDHYDINGDGIIDCPYDFYDKTDSDNDKTYSNNKDTNKKKFNIFDADNIHILALIVGIAFFAYVKIKEWR